MKKRILLSGAVAVLLASILVACAGGSFFPGGTVAYPTVPKFVVAVDGSNNGGSNFRKGNVANSSVNVFPVNATTGVLGAAVTGSPFDLGVTDAMTMAVHPNGHFV